MPGVVYHDVETALLAHDPRDGPADGFVVLDIHLKGTDVGLLVLREGREFRDAVKLTNVTFADPATV